MKKSFILILLTLSAVNGNSQEAKQTSALNVELRFSTFQITTPRYAKYPFGYYSGETGDFYRFPDNRYRMYRAEGSYKIHPFFRIGLWFDYGYIPAFKHMGERKPIDLETHVLGSGVKVSTHLLPLFFERFRKSNPRLDLYASTELGSFYFRNKWSGTDTQRVPALDGGGHTFKAVATIGGGAFFYVTKQIGIYVDYQYGGFLTKKTTEDNRVLSVPKVGLTLRF